MGGVIGIRISPRKVTAFRLSRQHLLERASSGAVPSVAGDIGGAQAQVLSAAQASIWARTSTTAAELSTAIWEKRTLARAWCMRRTMFLVPSDELALFVRGTTRRSEYAFDQALTRASRKDVEKLLDALMLELDVPRSRAEIARRLEIRGYRVRQRAGGGWGDSRRVPFVKVGRAFLSVGFILHAAAAREVICSGPSAGSESTYVRADKWLPHWKDIPRDRAEEEILLRYLRAFGPASVADFALWMGLYLRDARRIWSRLEGRTEMVESEGSTVEVLKSDLPELQDAEFESPHVRLLPNFDTFLLGHKSHGNVVDEESRKDVYRGQGWVSPVVLVDGRAAGVWAYSLQKSLEVRVRTFSKLSSAVEKKIGQEAVGFGEYLGSPQVKVMIG